MPWVSFLISSTMKYSFKKFFWFWLPPLGYMAAVGFMSAVPNPQIGKETPDYILHALSYFLLTLLLIRLLFSLEPKKVLKVATTLRLCPKNRCEGFLFWHSVSLLGVLAAVVFGTINEIHQYFIPQRHCSFQDIVANSIGAFMAYGVSLVDHVLLTRTSFKRRWTNRANWLKSLSYLSFIRK